MIDYEKLKVAHQEAKKLPFSSYSFDCWCCTGIESGYFYTLSFEDFDGICHEFESENIDDLIEEMKRVNKALTQDKPKPKYEVGAIVWILRDDEVFETNVDGVVGPKYYLNGIDRLVYENEIYPTKQALIEHQIEYWTNLKIEDEVDLHGCQHESTGTPYLHANIGMIGWQIEQNFPIGHEKHFKCKKCGEFYK